MLAAAEQIDGINRIVGRGCADERRSDLYILSSYSLLDHVQRLQFHQLRPLHSGARGRAHTNLQLPALGGWENLRSNPRKQRVNCQSGYAEVRNCERPSEAQHSPQIPRVDRTKTAEEPVLLAAV